MEYSKNKLRQRMYNLVLYSLSPIQKGIQAYHAGIEYVSKYGDTEEFQHWAIYDKTIIILDGGTSNRHGHTEYQNSVLATIGSMENHGDSLNDANIKFSFFYEPDLNNATSAIAFLCDEMVWDKKMYPDPSIDDKILFEEELKKWYGEKTAWLRMFLKQFKLA